MCVKSVFMDCIQRVGGGFDRGVLFEVGVHFGYEGCFAEKTLHFSGFCD